MAWQSRLFTLEAGRSMGITFFWGRDRSPGIQVFVAMPALEPSAPGLLVGGEGIFSVSQIRFERAAFVGDSYSMVVTHHGGGHGLGDGFRIHGTSVG